MSPGVVPTVRCVPPVTELAARTVHRNELSMDAICMVAAFVDSLKIPFSEAHNALYTRDHFVAVLLHMCKAWSDRGGGPDIWQIPGGSARGTRTLASHSRPVPKRTRCCWPT